MNAQNCRPTFLKIIKAKSVQAYKADPYVVTVINCAMWVFYGMPFVHPDSLLVVTINGAGFFIELVYVTIFIVFSSWGKRVRYTRFICFLLLYSSIFPSKLTLLKNMHVLVESEVLLRSTANTIRSIHVEHISNIILRVKWKGMHLISK